MGLLPSPKRPDRGSSSLPGALTPVMPSTADEVSGLCPS